MNIGDNIKKFRTEKGMTQKELADKIDRSLRMVQKYESGEVDPSIDILMIIGDALEINYFDLLDSDDSIINFDSNEETYHFTPKLTLDESLVSDLVSTLVINQEVEYLNLLNEDLKFIAETLNKNLVDLLEIIRYKNNYIYQAYYDSKNFKERIENDPHFKY